jgi:hypothetical protein
MVAMRLTIGTGPAGVWPSKRCSRTSIPIAFISFLM